MQALQVHFIIIKLFYLQNLVVHPSVASPLGAAQVQWIHATRRGKNKKKRKQFAADVSFMETLDEYKKEKAEEAAKGEKEPHMLHVVWRNKNRLTGRPWWEKEIVEKLNLDVEVSYMVVPEYSIMSVTDAWSCSTSDEPSFTISRLVWTN